MDTGASVTACEHALKIMRKIRKMRDDEMQG
jgi:hypothetical protein